MRKPLLVCCMVAFAVVAFGLYGCRRSGGGFTVDDVEGNVLVQVTDSSTWRVVTSGDRLKPGDVIKTESDSRGTLTLRDNGALKVAPATEVEIKTFKVKDNKPEIWLQLNRGDTFTSIKRNSAKYYVTTPVAVMGVVGTAFRLSVDEDTGATRLAVIRGTVSASKDDRKRTVRSGFALKITEGKPLGKPSPLFLPKEIFDGQPVEELLGDYDHGSEEPDFERDSDADDAAGESVSGMVCPKCGFKTEKGKFCPKCKEALAPLHTTSH